jgi:hypothetical protein
MLEYPELKTISAGLLDKFETLWGRL